MQDKRVLVTGGAGFIGSNLANRLASDNDVIAVDDTYLGTPENLDDAVEFELPDAIDLLIQSGRTIDAIRLDGWRIDVGYPEDRDRAEERLDELAEAGDGDEEEAVVEE